jgi:hypothetical protein
MINKVPSTVPQIPDSSNNIHLKGIISMLTYLYIKTHNKTGLKYLGITTSTDPHKYTGSGRDWKKHLALHGKDYTTEILQKCHLKEEVRKWGLYYSNLWNVVESEKWANLKVEVGDGGELSTETRMKISKSNSGKTASVETRKKMSNSAKGKTYSEETRKKISLANKGKKSGIGRKHSEETKKKISEANTGNKSRLGQPHLEDTKQKISNNRKGHTDGMTGKKHSEETKQKMREAQLNRIEGNSNED